MSTVSGTAIASMKGTIRNEDRQTDTFKLHCTLEVQRPIRFQILGASSIESEHTFDRDGVIQVEAGNHEITADVVFEFVFDR